MTTTPGTSKGKVRATSRARNWRVPETEAYPTEDELSALRLPFPIEPLTVSTIPGEFLANVSYINTNEAPHYAPWIGYYVVTEGIIIAVANAYGIWFEISKREKGW